MFSVGSSEIGVRLTCDPSLSPALNAGGTDVTKRCYPMNLRDACRSLKSTCSAVLLSAVLTP